VTAGKETIVANSSGGGFRPDYAIPPGETLRDSLDALGMTQADLARRTGLSTKHINQIIQGLAPITPDTALALERVVGVPARFWNALEANYQAQLLRMRDRTVSNEDKAWIKSVQYGELVRRGFLQATNDFGNRRDQLFTFFGVASRDSWEAVWTSPSGLFRRSHAFPADPAATAVWLRVGEIEAAGLEVDTFDRDRLQRALARIRALMVLDPQEFEPQMREALARAGVVFVVVDEIKGSRASGVARWLTPTKALMQLSLRGRWEDRFWFSFFHEAGHILLHGKRDVFVEGADAAGPEEEQADRFAETALIPEEFEHDFLRIRDIAAALTFAKRLGIPPGVVIGRLQREGILDYKVGNNYRRRFAFAPNEAAPTH
jgi:HTH-type transcriptional regulator / antitoxin HigA